MLELLAKHPTLLVATCAVLGLLVGSFLNVVIYRLPVMAQQRRDRAAAVTSGGAFGSLPASSPFNLSTPPSRCACGAPIRPQHNVPVVSWIVLKGRAACCNAPISPRYPLVELLASVLSAILAALFGYSGSLIVAIAVLWVAIPTSFIAWDRRARRAC